MERTEFQRLLNKYLAGDCTAEEKALLETWYLRYEAKALPPLSDRQLETIRQSAAPLPGKKLRPFIVRWTAAAAVVLLLVLMGLYLYRIGQDTHPSAEQLTTTHDLPPGGNRATLTLADGRTITLDEAQSGIIIGEEHITYADGSGSVAAVIRTAGTETAPASRELVLTIPRGGTYQVTLSDGSQVWLNAGSTLRYPGRFEGAERVVHLEGEGYFDIAKVQHPHRSAGHLPFKVVTNDQAVEVLGTEFNVSAYPEGSGTRTVLVEGAVRVAAAGASLQLAPGELAKTGNNRLTKEKANVEQAIAWKHGNFHFENESLESIMHKLSKWYDLEAVFEDPVEQERFYGMIGRDKTLSQVLKMLENTRTVRFVVEGNRVTITKRVPD